MAAGQAPENVLKKRTETDPARDLRQVGMVDAQGRAARFHRQTLHSPGRSQDG